MSCDVMMSNSGSGIETTFKDNFSCQQPESRSLRAGTPENGTSSRASERSSFFSRSVENESEQLWGAVLGALLAL